MMPETNFSRPPKRRYTVTAKVLEACRRNLEKATAVDPAIRFRRTEKRVAASRRNLARAHRAGSERRARRTEERAEALRQQPVAQGPPSGPAVRPASCDDAGLPRFPPKLEEPQGLNREPRATPAFPKARAGSESKPDSPGRPPGATAEDAGEDTGATAENSRPSASRTHSLYGPHAVPWLPLAGERREELEAHLERFREAFAPRDVGAGKLAEAMGMVAWRRLRAFRGEARREAGRLERALAEAIARAEGCASVLAGPGCSAGVPTGGVVTAGPGATEGDVHKLTYAVLIKTFGGLDPLSKVGPGAKLDRVLGQLHEQMRGLLEEWRAGRAKVARAPAKEPALSKAKGREDLRDLQDSTARLGDEPARLGPDGWGWPVRRLRKAARWAKELEQRGMDPDSAWQAALQAWAPRPENIGGLGGAACQLSGSAGYTSSLAALRAAFARALGGEGGASPAAGSCLTRLAEAAWRRLHYYRERAANEQARVNAVLARAHEGAVPEASHLAAETAGPSGLGCSAGVPTGVPASTDRADVPSSGNASARVSSSGNASGTTFCEEALGGHLLAAFAPTEGERQAPRRLWLELDRAFQELFQERFGKPLTRKAEDRSQEPGAGSQNESSARRRQPLVAQVGTPSSPATAAPPDDEEDDRWRAPPAA